jgi:serine/threonine protein kinase
MSGDVSWVGRRIGPYLIEEQIGQGGMGVVYRAEQTSLGRKVALKVIAPQLAQEPAFRNRFRRESRLAAAIDHPNIIPVYEAEVAGDDLLYIAMRYVEGTDLRAIIQRAGQLDVRRAATLVAQIASALDAAHSRDLVHRDVKPANVLVAGAVPHEHAYLTDFGLTKHMTSDSALTETGQWVGTLDFVAPEQIMAEAIDGRADVYSLGCVFFEALTGHPPFPRDTDVAKIYAHLNEPPPRVTDTLPELSREFDEVVGCALAKRREDRYRTAGDMRDAVLALVAARQRPREASSIASVQASDASTVSLPPSSPSRVPLPAQHGPSDQVQHKVSPTGTPRPRRPSRSLLLGLLLFALLGAVGGAVATGLFGNGGSASVKAAETTSSTSHRTASRSNKTSTQKTLSPRTTPTPIPQPTVDTPTQPRVAQLRPFQTGYSPGQRYAAADCETKPGPILYCWTPNDGYTVALGLHDAVKQRLRTDEPGNRGRQPGGFSILGLNQQRSGGGFTCTSSVSGLTCTNADGHGWTLPRYRGQPSDI